MERVSKEEMYILLIMIKDTLMDDKAVNLFGEGTTQQQPKRKKAGSEQVFKPYQQHQTMLLPPSLEELIPEGHVVRVVNKIIDGLKLDVLISTYLGGGTSAYHPVMLLKVLIYGYVSKIYASRRIAKALKEDVNFMWLAGMSRPDFRTINEFRSGRLKGVIDEVFGSTVMFLIEKKYIDLREYFVDGTKVQADSNRHKVIWAKNTKRFKEKYQEKIKTQLAYIDRVNAEENERYGDRDLEELGQQSDLTTEQVKEHIAQVNETLKQHVPTTPEQQQMHTSTSKAVKELQTKLVPKLEKYEEQEKILAGRNSYARTDTDATVFRTKDGRLLPAYNILLGTQRQFIVNYSFHQRRASEADGFTHHMEQGKKLLGKYPMLVMGDSAYGSEENYAFLAEQEIGNFLKYNMFHLEGKKKYRDNPYRKENFPYDADADSYQCPQGRRLPFKQTRQLETDNGYITTVHIYQSEDCRGCPVAALCKRGEGNRTIQVNPTLNAFRKQARENLSSERGIALRKKRGADVEPAIGDIKFNQGYRRCRLRGQAKVNVEIGLLSIAHNTRKIARVSLN